ncbi:MAG: hypothetical protein VX574_02595 [Myxococcota bacterium]|nr:hypothetical protein [Myxococcota bacterium]
MPAESPNSQVPPEPPTKGSPPNATPLDHPFFLPVLFIGCAFWFGYDAYLSQDPDILEHPELNRYGFRILVFLAPLWSYRGWCELQRKPENPWVLPGLLAAMAAWTAFDAWGSTDAFNLENATILRALVPWLVFAAAWYAFAAIRNPTRSRVPYGFAVVLGAPALWFGYQGFVSQSGEANALAFKASAITLGLVAAWSALSDLRRERRSPPPSDLESSS